MMKKNKMNLLVATIVAFVVVAVLLIFGYDAIVALLTAMSGVKIGDVTFLIEGGVMVAVWAVIAMFYVYMGRKTDYYQSHKPSGVPVTLAAVLTALLILSWVLRPYEFEASTAMIQFQYENPMVFATLNLAGAVCTGCAIGVGIGYYFFAKKVVIYRDDVSPKHAKTLYDRKTEEERAAEELE